MDKQQPNFRAFRELAAFATDSEGDLDKLTKEEVLERLSRQGINPDLVSRIVELRLKRIKNELSARAAASEADQRKPVVIDIANKRKFVHGTQAIAARAEGQASDDDIEVIHRLTHEDSNSGNDGTKD
jgi:hypothetical protein